MNKLVQVRLDSTVNEHCSSCCPGYLHHQSSEMSMICIRKAQVFVSVRVAKKPIELIWSNKTVWSTNLLC